MKTDKKKEFTLRITQANRTELIVILYDMILSYIEEAEECEEKGQHSEFKKEIKNAENCVNELISSLNFQYDISFELLALYGYLNRVFQQMMIRRNPKQLESAVLVVKQLRASFRQIAKQDHSESLMKNTQAVYAGLTYGKGSLNENFQDSGSSRGFWA